MVGWLKCLCLCIAGGDLSLILFMYKAYTNLWIFVVMNILYINFVVCRLLTSVVALYIGGGFGGFVW